MEKIIKKLNFSLNNGWAKNVLTFVFFIWMLFTLIGSINDINLTPWGLSKFVLIIGLLGCFCFYLINQTKKINSAFPKKIYKWLLVSFIILGLIWQILCVLKLSAPIGWDVWLIHQGLSSHSQMQTYLTNNPNNFFLFIFQYRIIKFFHLSPNWITVNFINLICLDLSFILNSIIVRKLNKNAVYYLWIFQGFLMFLLPQIVVPYSDIMCLPFISLYLLGFVIIITKFESKWLKYLGVIIFALGSICSYEMKPSAIIPSIVLLIYLICKPLKNNFKREQFKHYLYAGLAFCAIFFSVIFIFHYDKYNINKIKPNHGEPITHFIAIGMSDTGGWNKEQSIATFNMKTKKERGDYSNKIIKKQLSNYGLFGYLQFLINKNYANTSDGTFGWFRGDGPYFMVQPKHKNILQKIFYESGSHFKDYQFIAQFFWIFTLIILIFGISYINDFTQLLRISILGILTFLLIFEGGRSRYLIQMLPLILILNSLTFKSATTLIKKLVNDFKQNTFLNNKNNL